VDEARVEAELGTPSTILPSTVPADTRAQRTTFISSVSSRDNDQSHSRPYLSASGYSSAGSGYRTPKEANEERWQAESEAAGRPDKVAMREMYKELGGRKAKGKTKFGRAGETGARNVGGLGGDYDE
jgi:hypothetical protein